MAGPADKPQPHYGCETCQHFRTRPERAAAATLRGRVLCAFEVPQRIGHMRIEPVTAPCPSYQRREVEL